MRFIISLFFCWSSVGNEYVRLRKYNDAIKSYTAALRLTPDATFYYNRWVGRAASLQREGTVLTRNPNCFRAAALYNLQRYAEAVADCEAATGLKAGYDKAWNRLGYLWRW